MPDFDEYFNIFVGAGKALNDTDRHRACTEWVSLGEAEQLEAIAHARRAVNWATSPAYVPYPVNHLRSRAWTREAKCEPPRITNDRAVPIGGNKRDPMADMTVEEIEELEAFIREHERKTA